MCSYQSYNFHICRDDIHWWPTHNVKKAKTRIRVGFIQTTASVTQLCSVISIFLIRLQQKIVICRWSHLNRGLSRPKASSRTVSSGLDRSIPNPGLIRSSSGWTGKEPVLKVPKQIPKWKGVWTSRTNFELVQTGKRSKFIINFPNRSLTAL